MQRFAARAFYQIGRLLAMLRCFYEHAKPKGDPLFAKVLDQHIDDAKSFEGFITQVAELCRSIRFEYSVKAAERLIAKLHTARLTNREAIAEINSLDERIKDEMADRLFFSVTPENRGYYLEEPPSPIQANSSTPSPLWIQKENLFGTGVQNSFPSALFDFEEAATCIAFGRATACVMHLMRVVEVGLKTLALNGLQLQPQNDWGKHLNEIERELTNRYKKSGARTPDEHFYAEAAAQIGHIKTAWRNPTMHVDRRYTLSQAQEVFGAVRSFMQHLASRLQE